MSGKFRRVGRGKWWSYELDGQRLPSVTRLIGDGIPKPFLVDWSAGVAAEYAYDNIDTIARMDREGAVRVIAGAHNVRRNTAALKGTDVHRLGQSLALNEAVDVDEAVAGYVDAYLAFLTDWQPQPLYVEAALCSKRWCYGGTLDLLEVIAAISAELPVVVDVKTGGKGVYSESCLQVAAYRHADVIVDADGNEAPMPQTAGGYALWLADDGSYELMPLESGEDVFATFLHVAHVAAFMQRDRDELIGLPLAVPAEVAS